MITLEPLAGLPGIRHAFFTRAGGVSAGLYAGLNCGLGSNDAPEAVAENRARAMGMLGLSPDRLVTCYQIHSPDVVTVDTPFPPGQPPRADAMVTARPGLALGILTADCVPVLFCDPEAGVIGAAHAGWKGAVGGVLEATLAAMADLGARIEHIRAGIGPHIAQRSYEVGPEFRARFLAEDAGHVALFLPSARPDHWLFDLGRYVEQRLAAAGITACGHAPHDTAGEEDLFFSYRRATLRGEPDYGRGLSAIALTP